MYGQPAYGSPMAPMAPAPMYGSPMAPAPMYGAPMAPPMVAPAPVYAPPAPAYYPPPAPGPTIITIGNTGGSNQTQCNSCGRPTDSIPRKKVGPVAIAWCLCLLFTVGFYGLCLVPLCSDNCKDTQLVCAKCAQIKATISANCC